MKGRFKLYLVFLIDECSWILFIQDCFKAQVQRSKWPISQANNGTKQVNRIKNNRDIFLERHSTFIVEYPFLVSASLEETTTRFFFNRVLFQTLCAITTVGMLLPYHKTLGMNITLTFTRRLMLTWFKTDITFFSQLLKWDRSTSHRHYLSVDTLYTLNPRFKVF